MWQRRGYSSTIHRNTKNKKAGNPTRRELNERHIQQIHPFRRHQSWSLNTQSPHILYDSSAIPGQHSESNLHIRKRKKQTTEAPQRENERERIIFSLLFSSLSNAFSTSCCVGGGGKGGGGCLTETLGSFRDVSRRENRSGNVDRLDECLSRDAFCTSEIESCYILCVDVVSFFFFVEFFLCLHACAFRTYSYGSISIFDRFFRRFVRRLDWLACMGGWWKWM